MERRIWHKEYKGEGFKDEREIIKNRSKSKGEEEQKEEKKEVGQQRYIWIEGLR
jgi:hypothetical protein